MGRQLMHTKLVIWVVLAMHVYLLTIALKEQSYLTDDSIQYLTIAENMAEHGAYSQSYAAPFVPDYQRTPGYPVFLYLLGRNPLIILVLQHLMVLASGALIYGILQLNYGKKWAFYGAMLYLLQPYGAIFASYLLSETLFIFLLLAWLYFFLRFWRGDGWIAVCTAMLSLCLASLVRPVVFPLLMIVMAIAMLQALKLRRQWLPQITLILLVPMLVLGPWLLRSARETGQLSMSTMGAMGMLHGRLGGLEASRQGLGTNEQQLYMMGDSLAGLEMGLPALRSYPVDKQTHETERIARGVTQITLGYFWNHPWDAAVFQAKCFWQMFSGLGYGWAKDLTHSKAVAYLLAALQLMMNALQFLGLLLSILRHKGWHIQERLAFWTAAILLLVSAAAWADGRYRAVIDPMLVLLTVFVIWNYERRQAIVARDVETQDQA